MALSDRQIRNAEPKEKRYSLTVGGLYLEISPKGGKWWRSCYFINGKKYVLSLGVYPETSLKKAR